MPTRRRHISFAFGLLGVLCLLTGCVGGGEIDRGDGNQLDIVQQGHGVDPHDHNKTFTTHVRWANTARSRISLTTYGSGSCPNKPDSLTNLNPHGFTLTIHAYIGACTADLGPYTTVFRTPSGLNLTDKLAIKLHYPRGNGKDQILTLHPTVTR